MPSDQSPSSNARSTGTGSAAKGQHLPITAGVRALLGYPVRKNGLLPTAPLTAPPRVHHYEQPPLPENEEKDKGFHEIARDEESIEAERSGGAEPQDNFPASLPRYGALSSGVAPEHPVDQRSAPAAHREPASFDIPGVSTHRTEFTALLRTSESTKVTRPEESLQLTPDKTAPHASASLAHPRDKRMLDSEFLARLEHLFGEGPHVPNDSETKQAAVLAPLLRLCDQPGVVNGEEGGIDLARRLAELQRAVSELSATVLSQAAQIRDGKGAQRRERKTAPERRVVVQRIETPATTPHAFWERSRLGRFYLKIGR
jgi:hypothetical protein